MVNIVESISDSIYAYSRKVVVEILKSYLHDGYQAPLYYYRDRDKKEIDLLILKDGVIHPVEIKKTASPSKRMVRHFSVLKNLGVKTGEGGLICLADRSIPLTENVLSIPVGML